MGRVWYFAYGSNMQTATFRGRRGIEFSRALPARVPGWKLVLDKPPLMPVGEGFANIVADADSEVIGVLYEIGEEALEIIDLTEGVLIDNYRRVAVEAWVLDGSHAEPLRVHTLTTDVRDASLRPSTRYMALLIEGALEHGLPAEYVDILRAIPAHEASEASKAARVVIDEGLRHLLHARRARSEPGT